MARDDLPVQMPADSTTVTGTFSRTDDLPGPDRAMTGTYPHTVAAEGNLTRASSAEADDAAMDDNPYLPVATGEGYADLTTDSEYTTACPTELYRGGNDYARLRLTLMGCAVPGG